jgi:hypothetical protein
MAQIWAFSQEEIAMSTDPEVQAIISLIDKKIAKLQQTKELLLSEFGNNGTRQRSQPAVGPSREQLTGTRKQQVAEFLRQHGPTPRREIVERTGIPIGTIAYVLNDSETFRQSHGKWDVKKELKEQA